MSNPLLTLQFRLTKKDRTFSGCAYQETSHKLHQAAHDLDLPTVKELLTQGVDVNVADYPHTESINALHRVMHTLILHCENLTEQDFNNAFEIAKLLIDKGIHYNGGLEIFGLGQVLDGWLPDFRVQFSERRNVISRYEDLFEEKKAKLLAEIPKKPRLREIFINLNLIMNKIQKYINDRKEWDVYPISGGFFGESRQSSLYPTSLRPL